ncbi:MAG: SRPBCC domain-containing protein [Gammaproteobacteria bacterium]|nr:SRPBCC domain-containing protein [Gammaproteobacteria bacterium]MBI5617444.1 SRPBCC domain-containing protein [Gammaproteobacteria bacterium]
MPDTENPSLTLTRRIAAPPTRVFAAWTEPKMIARWWAPMACSDPTHAEIDLRVGGRYRIVMHAETGEVHDVAGEYTTVDPDRRLAFTWAWRSTPERVSHVTVDFARDGDGTLLTLRHERFFDSTARDNHRGGWTNLLDALDQHFTADAHAA